ncbi:hypothetical protein [Selenomonas sp. ND2010]|uniref:hypothetical protein n=1 Tax=Selenomonas sp. ND2010 TaxID=1410618 RepID=UPI0012DE9013|nr:hypothetical protein [Selenomonas sp. ND2010]
MPTELNTTDSLANIEYQSEKYLETKTMPSEMPIEHDTTDSVTDSEAQGVSPDTDKVSVSKVAYLILELDSFRLQEA